MLRRYGVYFSLFGAILAVIGLIAAPVIAQGGTEVEAVNVYVPLLEIALAIILARLLGTVFEHFSMPSILGEILAGIVLSISAIILMRLGRPMLDFGSPEFRVFGHIGIIFLMMLSGFEMDVAQMRAMSLRSTAIAVGGVVLPFISGYLIAYSWGFKSTEAMIMGTMLVATSVGISVRTLMDLNVIHTDAGTAILGAAVIDDILGIVILTFTLSTGSDATILGVHIPFLALFLLSILTFFFITMFLGLRYLSGVVHYGERHLHLPYGIVSITLGICFIFAALAREMEIATITGAFIAGLVMRKANLSYKVEEDLRIIGYSFFIPIYFVMVGTELDFTVFFEKGIIVLGGFVVLTAIIFKFAGAALAARLSGFGALDSARVGVAMLPRLEVILVVVTSAISEGALSGSTAHVFVSIAIMIAVVTTIITPFILKRLYS